MIGSIQSHSRQRYSSLSPVSAPGLLLGLLLLSGCAEHDRSDLERYINHVKQTSPGQPLPALPSVDPYLPYPYEAGTLKDPFAYATFVVDAMARQQQRQDVDPLFDSGPQPDLDRPREELESYALGALRMVGTFRDFATNDLWALIRAPDGVVHRVREGNYVGQNFGEIYAVREQSIDIQEIVRDPVTGGWRERDNRLSLVE